MIPLLTNVFLDVFPPRQCGCVKVVISDEIDDDMIDQRNHISALTTDPSEYVYYTNKTTSFLDDAFIPLMYILLQTDRRVTLFCDASLLADIYTYWIAHLVPDVTDNDIKDLLSIAYDDWVATDPTTASSLLISSYQRQGLPVNPTIQTLLQKVPERWPTVWRFNQALNGGDCTFLKTYIHQQIGLTIDICYQEIIKEAHRKKHTRWFKRYYPQGLTVFDFPLNGQRFSDVVTPSNCVSLINGVGRDICLASETLLGFSETQTYTVFEHFKQLYRLLPFETVRFYCRLVVIHGYVDELIPETDDYPLSANLLAYFYTRWEDNIPLHTV